MKYHYNPQLGAYVLGETQFTEQQIKDVFSYVLRLCRGYLPERKRDALMCAYAIKHAATELFMKDMVEKADEVQREAIR